jgi:hypothetical protein
MVRNTQPKQFVRRGGVTKVNPDGAVLPTGNNTYVSHEPLMEGMTWEEQVRQVREVNPDGVVIDMDTIIAADRPMETFCQQMREQCPDMSPLQLERKADIVSRIVKRPREQEFQAKMKEREEKMRELVLKNVELQRQIDEKERQLEQLRQQQ